VSADDYEPVPCDVCVEDDDGSEAAAWTCEIDGYVNLGVSEHTSDEATFGVCRVHALELQDTLRGCEKFQQVDEKMLEGPSGLGLVVLEPREGATGAAALVTFRALVCLDCAEGVLDLCGAGKWDEEELET
jgi:hypothetical protein